MRYKQKSWGGKPFLPVILPSTHCLVFDCDAYILGPWGKGQENYKQPWHSWAAKPTAATAYLWTYMRQINPHVFQPLWSNFFFLTQMNVTLNWSTSTSSVLFLLSCNHAWNFFLLTIFSLNVCLPNLTHHWRLGSNNSHFRGFYFIPSQSRCATFFFWPISVASIVFYLDLFCGIYSYIYKILPVW